MINLKPCRRPWQGFGVSGDHFLGFCRGQKTRLRVEPSVQVLDQVRHLGPVLDEPRTGAEHPHFGECAG